MIWADMRGLICSQSGYPEARCHGSILDVYLKVEVAWADDHRGNTNLIWETWLTVTQLEKVQSKESSMRGRVAQVGSDERLSAER